LAEWAKASKSAGAQPDLVGEAPRLWKTIGDEVLFVKVLSDYRQLAVALNCWKAAARGMREFLKGHDPRLDVKCSAWVAGFPIKDAEVVLDSAAYDAKKEVEDYFKESGNILNSYYAGTSEEGVSIDFIGPSIDIGFRISQHATSRKFTLSVDIPFILSLINPQDDGILDEIPIFYEGSVPLKGVFGGVDYPLFWMNMSPAGALSEFEDKLTKSSPVPRDDLRKYCEAFYKEHSAYTFRPFISADGEQQIVKKPDWYDEAHSNMVKSFLNVASDEPQATEEPSSDTAVETSIKADVEGIVRKLSTSPSGDLPAVAPPVKPKPRPRRKKT
jgi:hypothetical protein